MKNTQAFTLLEIMVVVVIIGLLAVMAFPAFEGVRSRSRTSTISNNLRQIASAGGQYILDRGVTQVSYSQLLNDGRFPAIQVVASEDYTTVTMSQATNKIMVTGTGNQRIVYTYN